MWRAVAANANRLAPWVDRGQGTHGSVSPVSFKENGLGWCHVLWVPRWSWLGLKCAVRAPDRTPAPWRAGQGGLLVEPGNDGWRCD